MAVGKGPSVDGFHGNQPNEFMYRKYQYIDCNLCVVKGGNVKLTSN